MRKRNRRGRHRRKRRAGVHPRGRSSSCCIAIVRRGSASATGTAFSPSCDLSSLHPVAIGQNSFVYAADGSLLGSIPAERNREPVPLGRMSPWLPKATIAVEDRRFYQHGGVDYEGIARALWRDVSAGKVVEGGSTIAQQLVRNLYTGRRADARAQAQGGVPRDQAQPRVPEAADPARVPEHRLLRQPRLRRRGRGADVLLRHARRLTLSQAALLAGLPQAPSIYDPFHNPKAAIARRNEVLQRDARRPA